jgi:hypothetical protein
MKRFLVNLAITVAGLLCLSATATAGEHMTVTLSNPTDPAYVNQGKVILTIKNDGDTNVVISKFKIPDLTTGELGGQDFIVISTYFNSPVKYTGWQVKPGPLTSDAFITMGPGEIESVMVDLLKSYNSLGGANTVFFTLRLGQFPDSTPPVQDPVPNDPRLPHEVVSNTLSIQVIPHQQKVSPRKGQAMILRRIKSIIGGNSYTVSEYRESPSDPPSCTAAQLDRVQHAANDAYAMATSANETRLKMYMGAYDPSTKYSKLYESYLGAHAPAAHSPDEGTNEWYSLDGQAEARIFVRTASWSFEIQCMCPGASELAAARTRPSYTQLCPIFFTLPTRGYTSQASTVYHELTHYGLELYNGHEYVPSLAATDYVYGYQQDKYLATLNKAQAINNADSFENFAVAACILDIPCWPAN